MNTQQRGSAVKKNTAPFYDSIAHSYERSKTEPTQISNLFPFIRPGKTLLIGREQTGKSFLEKMMAYRIAIERKEPVAILTEDMQYILDLQNRIIVEGNAWKAKNDPNEYTIDIAEADKYVQIFSRVIMKKLKINWMQFLQKYGDNYCCIFADRLSLFTHTQGIAYENISAAIDAIDDVLADMKYLLGIVLTHHERKFDPVLQRDISVDRIFENVNGSVAYLASTETHIVVRKTHHSYDRKLYVRGKGQDSNIYIVQEGKGFIDGIEQWNPALNLSDTQKKIYKTILINIEHRVDTDVATIADSMGEENINALRAQLSKMVSKEVLVRENGMYYPSEF